MRVVLDTNILFSALISPHGKADVIYRAWRSGRFEIVTSQLQLDEIRRASRYPKFRNILQPAKVGTMEGSKFERHIRPSSAGAWNEKKKSHPVILQPTTQGCQQSALLRRVSVPCLH